MIWNGTDPLQPDHEVAYRGWPTERVYICKVLLGRPWSILVVNETITFATEHDTNGHHGPFRISPYNLIPLQKDLL